MWRGDGFAYPHKREDEDSPKEMARGSWDGSGGGEMVFGFGFGLSGVVGGLER